MCVYMCACVCVFFLPGLVPVIVMPSVSSARLAARIITEDHSKCTPEAGQTHIPLGNLHSRIKCDVINVNTESNVTMKPVCASNPFERECLWFRVGLALSVAIINKLQYGRPNVHKTYRA